MKIIDPQPTELVAFDRNGIFCGRAELVYGLGWRVRTCHYGLRCVLTEDDARTALRNAGAATIRDEPCIT